jgi:predicted dinucleotide-binding enzyme
MGAELSAKSTSLVGAPLYSAVDAAKSQVGELVRGAGLPPIDAGRLDNGRR